MLFLATLAIFSMLIILSKHPVHTSGLQQLALYLQVKGLSECTQQVVCGRPQTRVRAAQVKQGHIEQCAGDVLWSDLGVDGHRLGLRQLPSGPDVNDVVDNVITVVMNEGKGSALVGYRQRELIVINQTDLGRRG